MPLLVYGAVSGQPYARAMPLAASWALNLAACHLLDKAQDSGSLQSMNSGVVALGAANVALARLDAENDTLGDILDAIGRATALGANAQSDELEHGRTWSRTAYFRHVAGKSAAIIATGVWIGGRLATDGRETLVLLQEFGLALGMAIQLLDDCLDLAEDLGNGTYTLPVIEGLAITDHPDYPALKCVMDRSALSAQDVQTVVSVLKGMGAVDRSRRVARAYQAQAAAAFRVFPGLAPYFADYVASES